MKLSELNAVKESLAKLLQAPGIPVKAAYRAVKFSKAVAKEIKDLEEERIKLVRKYGVADSAGNVAVPALRLVGFNEEFDELLDEDVDIPATKINIEDVKSAGLTMLDVANLDFLFEEAPNKE